MPLTSGVDELLQEASDGFLLESGVGDYLLLEGSFPIVQFISFRERPPLRLHIDLETPSGKHYRWGEDEPNPANVPGDVRCSSTMPGGFESADVTLPRKPGVDYSDLERLSTLRAIGAGGDIAGEYRLERTPRTSGDRMAISSNAVGWQAHLDDDKFARGLYVDRDLSHWVESSRARQIALLTANYSYQGPEVNSDSAGGLPAVSTRVADEWASPVQPLSEAMFDAKGLPIGAIYYDAEKSAQVLNGDPLWGLRVRVASDDVLTAFEETSDLHNGTLLGYFEPTTSRPFGFLVLYYEGTPGGAAAYDYRYWWQVAVYGDHGLPRRGADPGGLYASDVIAHAVRQWAPHLVVDDENIQPSGFVIDHLAFLEPVTAAEIVRQANRFHLRDWAVWEDRKFYYHDRGARGRKWRARIAPAQLEETGPQVDRLWESVIVSFQDVDGTTKTVGPPGSGADTESVLLKDTDPENPANRLGITRRDLLQMGTATAASAAEVGAIFLREQKLLDTSGRAQLVGHVEDDRGVLHPAWRVRAGDQISFVDAADSGYRRIVKADYAHPTRTCSVDLDAPPEGLAALLERLGVVLIPLGVGN